MRSIKTYEGFFDFFKKKNNSIDSICKKWGIKNYTINEDGTIDVDGTVNLYPVLFSTQHLKMGITKSWYSRIQKTDYHDTGELTEIPLKFRNVTGDFYLMHHPAQAQVQKKEAHKLIYHHTLGIHTKSNQLKAPLIEYLISLVKNLLLFYQYYYLMLTIL